MNKICEILQLKIKAWNFFTLTIFVVVNFCPPGSGSRTQTNAVRDPKFCPKHWQNISQSTLGLALPWGALREWRFQAPRSRAATTGVSTPAPLVAAVSSVSKSEKSVTNSAPVLWHFGTGSVSLDPYTWFTDPDLFVSDIQDANKKYVFFLICYARYFLKWYIYIRIQR